MTAKKPSAWIVSTLTDSVDYTAYGNGGGDIPLAIGHVTVAGGANIPDKYMRIPEGVVTPVTDAELELLMNNSVFKLHKDNGYIQIRDKEPKSVEVAVADMEGRDPAAPLVDQDFPTEQQPKSNSRKA